MPELTKFPEVVWRLPHLTQLSMECRDIPAQLTSLTNLKELIIICFRPNKLPEGIQKLNRLRFLSVTGDLPTFTAQLPSLEELVLKTRDLELSTPDFFQKLPKLSKAQISFQSMPVALNVIGLQNLRELELKTSTGNIVQFTGTNTSIANLRVEGKTITEISGVSGLQNLKTLLINNTSVKALPTNISALKNMSDLQCSNSSLTTFPIDLVSMPNLTRIALYQNQMSGKIPVDILKMPRLTELKISVGNSLVNLNDIKNKAKFNVE